MRLQGSRAQAWTEDQQTLPILGLASDEPLGRESELGQPLGFGCSSLTGSPWTKKSACEG